MYLFTMKVSKMKHMGWFNVPSQAEQFWYDLEIHLSVVRSWAEKPKTPVTSMAMWSQFDRNTSNLHGSFYECVKCHAIRPWIIIA